MLKKRKVCFIYLDANSLLAKILKMYHLAHLANASAVCINETKLGSFVIRML